MKGLKVRSPSNKGKLSRLCIDSPPLENPSIVDSDFYPLSPALTLFETTSPCSSSVTVASVDSLSLASPQVRGSNKKLERIFGLHPTQSAISPSAKPNNFSVFKSRRSGCRSVENLGQRFGENTVTSNPMMKGHRMGCWIDTDPTCKSDGRIHCDELLTPVSPIIFSDEVPAPPPMGAPCLELGDTGMGLVVVKPIIRRNSFLDDVPEYAIKDAEGPHSKKIASDLSKVNLNTFSLHTRGSPIDSPVSPIVFARRESRDDLYLIGIGSTG
ncbi:hypothetical protein VKT23_001019 [Stygiomarasmius scandens]|uniref:Uncharacterized protein n=1 Tax=Marasmiellus scandens TaxID=2682957 RepID=A0ABR1K655_9AGAR